MRKIMTVLVATSILCTSLSGCYGKMALTRKVYRVNGEVKDKYLRSLVTWAFIIVPVYGISALADFIVFNTIEFWSGRNPVAEGEKNFQYASDGENYFVNARKSGNAVQYTINHYSGKNYMDTLSINWDLKTGNSTAMLKEFDKTTDFVAMADGNGVKVKQFVKGINAVSPVHVAAYVK